MPTIAVSRANRDGRGAWVDVDLAAILDNAQALASLLPQGTVVAPVVKADAYGHGAVEVSRTLAGAGFGAFCVATRPGLAAAARLARSYSGVLSLHIKLDTGLGRQGLLEVDLPTFLAFRFRSGLSA